MPGIEPGSQAWEACTAPDRKFLQQATTGNGAFFIARARAATRRDAPRRGAHDDHPRAKGPLCGQKRKNNNKRLAGQLRNCARSLVARARARKGAPLGPEEEEEQQQEQQQLILISLLICFSHFSCCWYEGRFTARDASRARSPPLRKKLSVRRCMIPLHYMRFGCNVCCVKCKKGL